MKIIDKKIKWIAFLLMFIAPIVNIIYPYENRFFWDRALTTISNKWFLFIIFTSIILLLYNYINGMLNTNILLRQKNITLFKFKIFIQISFIIIVYFITSYIVVFVELLFMTDKIIFNLNILSNLKQLFSLMFKSVIKCIMASSIMTFLYLKYKKVFTDINI